MASGTGTVTIDTNEWTYVDRMGVKHLVSNGETFTFTSTDNSSTSVIWKLDAGQSVATDDGLTIHMDDADGKVFYLEFADANDGAAKLNPGSLVMLDPQTGMRDEWICKTATVDDVDDPTTIAAEFEARDDNTRTFTWDASVDISFT